MNENYADHHRLKKGQLDPRKFVSGQTTPFEISAKLPWVQEILDELYKDVIEGDRAQLAGQGQITVAFTVRKSKNSKWGEHLLVCGHVDCDYHSSCVRCLAIFKQTLSKEINALFIDRNRATTQNYDELSEVFVEDELRDLFLFEDYKIDLKQFLLDEIFSVKDPFPTHLPDCKGLCQYCGVDLNQYQCSHVKEVAGGNAPQ